MCVEAIYIVVVVYKIYLSMVYVSDHRVCVRFSECVKEGGDTEMLNKKQQLVLLNIHSRVSNPPK